MTEQELNLYLKDILNTMNDGLFVTRPDGSIMMVNEAFLRMTGYTRDEIMDKPCLALNCDACRRSIAQRGEHWCRLFNTKNEMMRSCRIRKKDGTYLHVIKNASLLQNEEGATIGAVETLTDISELDKRDRKIEQLSRRLAEEDTFYGMIGHSPAMTRVFDLLIRAAASEAPVIIFGESGTGKELAATAIHELGPRSAGPFVRINCAAFNESLLESEIFGHVKGAFTGAIKHRMGRFEEASGGDVFLDEIGDVPLSIQIKLLRVLETKSYERVGENSSLDLNARIITATNQDLRTLVEQGRFRKDFFFRINVIPIHLPPLRERHEDIAPLTELFIKRLNQSAHREIHGLDPEAMELFYLYSWPGNVRELKSALEYSFVVCDDSLIKPQHLPPALTNMDRYPPPEQSLVTATEQSTAVPEKKAALIAALRASNGNKSAAARALGVTRVTVHNRMRKYGINLAKDIVS